ncbi:MAG: CPBP family intramembrane metalloprotease [Clostridia bacterium]|nr:CPBP family intramembrane metalloprotease [Clostridia bacterium]
MKHKNTLFVPLLTLVVSALLTLDTVLLDAIRDVGGGAFLSVSIVSFLILLVPMAFYCGLTRRSFARVASLKLPALRDVPFALYVALAFLFGSATIKYLTCAFFTSASAVTGSLVSAPLYTASNTPLVVLCFILLPAVLEQALFSGLVLTEYREYGDVICVLMSALMFAMAHGSFVNFAFYLFGGLCMALVTRITASILPAALIAALSAALDLYYESLFFEYVTLPGTGSILFYFFCGLFLLFSVLAVSHLEKSYARRARSVKESALVALEEARREQESERKEEKSRLSFGAKLRLCFLSPVFILLIALFVIRASGVL